jgi:hypothetical protein
MRRCGSRPYSSAAGVSAASRLGGFGKLVRVGTDHETDDLISTLPVEAVRVVKPQFNSSRLIALLAQKPTGRRLNEYVRGNFGSHVEHPRDRERVGGVLFAAEHIQVHLADKRVAQFVGQHKQDVAADEPDQFLALLLRQLLEPRVVFHGVRGLVQPGPELRRSRLAPLLGLICGPRLSRLRHGWIRPQQEDAAQGTNAENAMQHRRLQPSRDAPTTQSYCDSRCLGERLA